MKPVLAWHFAKENNRLNFKDGREIVVGETHSVSTEENELTLCNWGLHASKRIIDALSYSPGPIIYRVELSGEIIIGDDKMVAAHRKYLWGFDATDLLRDFSRRCALDVIHLWDAPDVVIEYLNTGNEDLMDAARDAAWSAAWAAAWAAARDAAWSAAWAAAWAAARDAAWAAARDAAWSAAWDAARAAELTRFNRRLTSMVIAEHKMLNK